MSMIFTTTSAFANNPKVAVVGAGLAGLTTAYRLQKEGMDLDLYEAKNRVGGRVFTVYLSNSIAELGGQNISDGGRAPHIHHLVDELGLELCEKWRIFTDESYFDGKDLISTKELIQNLSLDLQILRTKLHEIASTSRNMKEVLSAIIKEDKMIAFRLAAYEGAPPEKLSPLYSETLFHILSGGISSAYPKKEEENHITLMSIRGGNALLAEKMAKTLDSRLHLNTPLKKVMKNQDGSFELSFCNDQKIKADILVLAIPCSVYEKIEFAEETIAPDRLKAIKSIQYGTNAKILVPFSQPPSERNSVIGELVGSFFDKTSEILTIYCTKQMSKFSQETINDIYAQTRPMMQMSFKEACPPFTPAIFAEETPFATYDSPIGYSWPNDPYIKGSYSYISPGQEELLNTLTEEKGEKFKTLFAPIEERLYFAGEHASILIDFPGTMEAACESGERVA